MTLEQMNARRETLKAVFDRVCDPKDWKAEIYAEIPASQTAFNLLNEAVEFFTATRLQVVGIDFNRHISGFPVMVVKADGYRKGPAGDH